MERTPTLQDVISAFASAETRQQGAEALFAALAPWNAISVVLVDAHEDNRDTVNWDEPARAMSPELWAKQDAVVEADSFFPLTVATRRMRRPFRWSEMGPDYRDDFSYRKHWELGRALSTPELDGIVVPRFHKGWLVAAVCVGFYAWTWDDDTTEILFAAGAAFVNRFSREPEYKTLTKREGECLMLVARGMTDKQIARELGVTAGTVKGYLDIAQGKLAARNRVEAVARHLAATMEEARQGKRAPELSEREHLCLFRAMYGATDDEIAANIGIAVSTVHGYIESAKAKLGARTRAQAIAELARRGGL
jgi:DNA-binding CsgD family transcriptional regulator